MSLSTAGVKRHRSEEPLDGPTWDAVQGLRRALLRLEKAFDAQPKLRVEARCDSPTSPGAGSSPAASPSMYNASYESPPPPTKAARPSVAAGSAASADGGSGSAASRYEVLASSVRLAASEVLTTDLMAATDDSLRERFVPHTEVGVKVPGPARQKGVLSDAVPGAAGWLNAAQPDKYVVTKTCRRLVDLKHPNELAFEGCSQYTGVTGRHPQYMVAGGSSNRPCRGGPCAAALVHDRIQRLMFPSQPLARCCNFAEPGEWQAVPLTTGRMGFALYQPEEATAQPHYTPYDGASVHLEHWIASAWAFVVPLEATGDADAARAQQLLSARQRGLAPRPYPVNERDADAFDCELCDGSRALLYRGVKSAQGSKRFTVSSSLRQLAVQDNTMQPDDSFETPLEAALMVDGIVRSHQPRAALRLVNFAASEEEVQYLPCSMKVRSKVLQVLRNRAQSLE